MIFRRLILVAFTTAGLWVGSQAALGAEMGTILVAGLNVRSGPGKDYTVIMQLAQGVQVNILERENGWLKIAFKDQQGFVRDKSNFIEIVPAEDLAALEVRHQAKDLSKGTESIPKQLERARSEVAAISRKEKAVIQQFDAADEALNKARKQVRAAKAAIAETDAKIEQIEKESSVLQKEIRTNEAYAAHRLSALYKLYWVGRIQVLATSESFFDFIKRKSAIECILDQDEVLLVKLHNDRTTLESSLARLNTRKTEKRALQAKLKQRISRLSEQQEKRRTALKRIQNEKSLELAALKALKQAAFELDLTLQSLPPAKKSADNAVPELDTRPFLAYKGLLSWPVKGKIISFFGPYRDKKFKVMNFQSGINIKAERGEPIRAISDGITIYASWFKGFGNMMIVDHGDHYYTVYAHLEEVFKLKGDHVEKDEVIATVGDSGSMMGPALHFEVRHHGKPIDPLKWIRKG